MTSPGTRTLDILDRLIAFDTTSRNSNLDLIRWAESYLAERGVTSALQFDETGEKANLWATIGPADVPGVMLSGHSDVVPVDGQEWASDPFRAETRDGRIYGRGTADMKAFIAICLAHADDFAAARLKMPVHIALSYDEEVGCLGGRQLASMLSGLEVKPRLCVVGEPTNMGVVIGHKGKSSYRCHVRGFECHSSLTHEGVNAVEYAALTIAAIRRLAEDKRANGPFDEAFDPPYTTVHTGVVQGGTALNIVPRDCEFLFEFRNLPADEPEDLLARVREEADRLCAEMRAVRPETGIEFERVAWFAGLETSEDAEVATLAKSFAQTNATSKVSFGTEAGHYHGAGVPTIVCGPGDIAQAHKPDEFVALDQIAACEAFFGRLLGWMTD
ncbi:MAG: acetylornithine deacetylase (ArgE) [Rhizobiales bacterium NRL2]|jgi:acetylornithine deacetylase|nr:MAG: acetylornithine deacetylase (ArgE) [Rhizobiales bacterium NRL2]